MLLLPLHAPVLEPDLDLALAQVQHVRQLDAPTARQVAVEVELLLQLQRLVTSVGRARPLAVFAVHAVCKPKGADVSKTAACCSHDRLSFFPLFFYF